MPSSAKPNPTDIMATEKFLLTLSGIYPLDHPNCLHYFSRMINCVASYFLLLTFIVGLMLAESLMDSLDTLKVCVIHGFFVGKLTAFMVNARHMKQIETLLQQHLFNLHKIEQHHFVRDTINGTSRIGNVYRTSCILFILASVVLPPFLHLDDRQVPLSGWYGFDTKKYFVPVWCFQMLALSISAYNNTSIDILNTRLISMASAQIDLLMDNLRKCVPSDIGDDKRLLSQEAERRLKICIEHHEMIIKFRNYIERIFSMGNLSQFMCSIIVIGVTGFNTIMIPLQSIEFVATIIFLFIVMTQIGLYCWYGNVLLVKSADTIGACYECNWYLCDVRVQKIIIIMMERMKRPIKLTAGRFFILSLPTLMAILRSSYSYIAVLQRMYNE